MHTRASLNAEFAVSTHNPSNLVVVENQGETLLIRAAQNNFSQRRKAFLIRQFAAEGSAPRSAPLSLPRRTKCSFRDRSASI